MKNLPNLDDLYADYLTGVSAAELGQRCDVSGDTVLARFRKAGLLTRTKAEAAKHPRKCSLVSISKKGKTTWNKGLTRSDSRVAAYSDKLVGRLVSEETRVKISRANYRGNPFFDVCRECGRKKGHSKRPRCCFCAAKWRAANCVNGMKGKKLSHEHKMKLMAANKQQTKPTKPELAMAKTLYNVFGPYNPYRYSGCGDNRFWVRAGSVTKNPDFVSTKLRKVIEVFGRYWHLPEDEEATISHYKSAGWDCLIVWEDERFNRDRVLYFTYPEEEENELWDFLQTPL